MQTRGCGQVCTDRNLVVAQSNRPGNCASVNVVTCRLIDRARAHHAEARKTRALQAELDRVLAARQRQLKLAEIEAVADLGKIQHQLRSISRDMEALGENRRHRNQSSHLHQQEPANNALNDLQEKLVRIEREYDDLLQEFADSVNGTACIVIRLPSDADLCIVRSVFCRVMSPSILPWLTMDANVHGP